MTTHVSQPLAVTALTDVWDRLDALLSGLDDDEWTLPTNLPGWTVQDIVAHIIGTEEMLRGNAPATEIDRTTFPTCATTSARSTSSGWRRCATMRRPPCSNGCAR